MDIKKSFLGTGWNFPPTFHKEFWGVEMISDEPDIRSSLDILFSTDPGERVMQPLYGCALRKFVFEPMNVSTRTMMEKIIKDSLMYHEPRIIVETVQVGLPANTDPRLINQANTEGILPISIEYRVITTNTRYNYVFPFYYNEGTNLVR
ncbi:MAG: GPW/gp25 family protein [Flavisolibacter sp.]